WEHPGSRRFPLAVKPARGPAHTPSHFHPRTRAATASSSDYRRSVALPRALPIGAGIMRRASTLLCVLVVACAAGCNEPPTNTVVPDDFAVADIARAVDGGADQAMDGGGDDGGPDGGRG